MNLEERFPRNYAKTNVDLIVSKISNGSNPSFSNCITVIGPSGFGKTHLLRYLAFNKAYKMRYRRLRRIDFIYIDTHEVILDRVTNIAGFTWNQEYSPETIALEKTIYRKVMHKIEELEKKPQTLVETEINWSKGKLLEALDYITNLDYSKKIYMIFDDIQELLEGKNSSLVSDLFKYIRDRYRGRIEFMFSLDSTGWFEGLNTKSNGELANLLVQEIVYLKLTDIKETYFFNSEGVLRIFDELILKHSPWFRKRIKRLNYLTGGYLPYKKHLINNPSDLFGPIQLTAALNLPSEKLLESLTERQRRLLKNIALRLKVRKTPELDFLIETNLIKVEYNHLRIFSPIMEKYLTK